MMRIGKKFLRPIAMVGICFLLSIGCGDLRGPGSDNSEHTGGVLEITYITPQDVGTDTHDIDVIQHCCDTACTKWEPFTDANMKLTFSYRCLSEQECGEITLLSYRVEYFTDDAGGVPLDPIEIVTQGMSIESDEELNVSGLVLMPIDKKKEFINKGGDYTQEPMYEVKVTFFGVNAFGYKVKTWTQTYILLADWEHC